MMGGWATAWKVIFFCSVTAFGVMAVWVTFAGFLDIKRMFSDLRRPSTPDENVEKQSGTDNIP